MGFLIRRFSLSIGALFDIPVCRADIRVRGFMRVGNDLAGGSSRRDGASLVPVRLFLTAPGLRTVQLTVL